MTRTKLIEIDLLRPPAALPHCGGYDRVRALVRLGGTAVGDAEASVRDGVPVVEELHRSLLADHTDTVVQAIVARWMLEGGLHEPLPELAALIERLGASPPAQRSPAPLPSVSVAVCTRDRPDDLRRCLDALHRLVTPAHEIVVVDNAPATEATAELVRREFPNVRYVREPRPGLDWARNRAVLESSGEIVAFTDDDVVVAPDWVDAIARLFAETPSVMAMTGLVVPLELETDAQQLFERYAGFGKGFQRRWNRLANARGWPHPEHHGAGRYGTGANMAFRRTLFDSIGGFDPALDVGTVTNGGGDLDFYFRVLEEGHTLVYEPSAVVWHRHRASMAELRHQLWTWGTGFFAYLARESEAYPAEREAIRALVRWWFFRRVARRIPRDLLGRSGVPADLVLGEVRGSLSGSRRYEQARRRAEEIAAQFPGLPSLPPRQDPHAAARRATGEARLAVRSVELHEPLQPLRDLAGYHTVEVCLFAGGRPVGRGRVAVEGEEVSVPQLRDVVARHLAAALLRGESARSRQALHRWLGLALPQATGAAPSWRAAMPSGLRHDPNHRPERLAGDVAVSVVVATADRPDDLRRCLQDLQAQVTSRAVEIVVVDNRPGSGVTPAVVVDFPAVRLISERRPGLSVARNAGIRASHGEIIVCTDDDVRLPPHWLEALVAPFARPEVGFVTGNVLPLELETRAQQLFELYGGLGRGFVRREADAAWFASFGKRAVPTWELGATANAAFRASVLRRPDVGLFDERLGAGTPTGCSEDTLAFYRVLRAGYHAVYEPDAYAWHRHRRTLDELRSQLHAYSRGHVAYHLTTWLEDGDRRAWHRLLGQLPVYDLKLVYRQLRGWDPMPWPLRRAEILGHLVGPWALWQSHRRAARARREAPAELAPAELAPAELAPAELAPPLHESPATNPAHRAAAQAVPSSTE